MKKIKYLTITLILIIYSTGVWAQVNVIGGYYTTQKCSIVKIGKVDILSNGSYLISGWEFDCRYLDTILPMIGEYHNNKGSEYMTIAGWAVSDLYQMQFQKEYSFSIESWYENPKGTFAYARDPSIKDPYEFNPTELMNKSISSFLKSQDTLKPQVFYGIAGIKKQPIDSSKYFYRRFMAERKRGIPDSLNKFKSKLYKK